MVWLDGDDMPDATREGASDDSGAGADFDDLVAFFEIGVTDKGEGEAWGLEKMLR